MERKIGEVFEYNGEWYQCIEDTERISCINCCFYNGGHKLCTDESIGACASEYRSDKKSMCFKKLEKVGEPYIIGNKLIQRYKIYPTTYCINVYGWYYQNFDVKSWTIDIEIKQNKEDMEEKKLNLKPFDIQKAREGKPVYTRDGRKARIICFDGKGDQPIIALIEAKGNKDALIEKVERYFINGHSVFEVRETNDDLMMLPEKKEGWVNVYQGGKLDADYIYPTKETAVTNIFKSMEDNYIDTIKVNWSE